MTLNDDILLQKLQHNGIKRIFNQWFKSYCKQCFMYTNKSLLFTIQKGLPQVGFSESCFCALYKKNA